MKTKWIHKNNNKKCILFFNGWGCDETPFLTIKSNEYDVFMCYDYKDLYASNQIESLFNSYEEIFLVAWSLGVYVANVVCKQWHLLFANSIAINGTLQPINDLKGIPPSIFQGTINGLSDKSLNKFWLRMCGGKTYFDNFIAQRPKRALEEQKEELIQLQKLVHDQFVDWNIYNSVLIGGKDLIFPFKNSKNSWKDHNCVIIKNNAPHYCFYLWNLWDDLIKECGSETSEHR